MIVFKYYSLKSGRQLIKLGSLHFLSGERKKKTLSFHNSFFSAHLDIHDVKKKTCQYLIRLDIIYTSRYHKRNFTIKKKEKEKKKIDIAQT